MNSTPSSFAGNLTEMFESSQQANGLALQEIRENYYVSAQMNENDDTSIGGMNRPDFTRHSL